jgi:hypothetical protein
LTVHRPQSIFSVVTRDKEKGREGQRELRGEAPLAISPSTSTSLVLGQDDEGEEESETLNPSKLASRLFLEELREKKDAYHSGEVPFFLSKQEKYFTFYPVLCRGGGRGTKLVPENWSVRSTEGLGEKL